MTETYRTSKGGSVPPNRWVIEKRTTCFITFCLLEWSTDLTNEAGVMYKTDTKVRVKVPSPRAMPWKKGFGYFEPEDRMTITVRDK